MMMRGIRSVVWMMMAAVLMAAGPVQDVRFSVQSIDGVTRLVSDWGRDRTKPVGFSAEVKNQVLIVRFDEPMSSDVTGLAAQSAAFAMARLDDDQRTLRVALRDDYQVKTSQSLGRVAVDLLKPGQDPLPAVGTAKKFDDVDMQAPRLTVRGSTGRDFGRLAFHWDRPVAYTTAKDGDVVTLTFKANAKPNLAAIRAQPPKNIKTVTARSVNGQLRVAITLAPNAGWRHWKSEGKVVFDATPPKPEVAQAPKPDTTTSSETAKAETADAVAKTDTLDADPATIATRRLTQAPVDPITGKVFSDLESATVKFNWPAPVGMAAFRRGDHIWVLFDTPAKLDLAELQTAKRYIKEIDTFKGPSFTGFRAKVHKSILLSVAADEASWSLRFGTNRQDTAEPLEMLRRNQEGMGASVVMAWPEATQMVWVPDPVVQDQLAVVLAKGPARGMVQERVLVDAELLETAHGLVVSPKVEDLTVEVMDEEVALLRPKGMTLSGGLISFANAAGAKIKDKPIPASGGFIQTYGRLTRAAAMEENAEDPPVVARMGLAKFLMENGLAHEANGLLNILAQSDPIVASSQELRMMRGITHAMMGRYDDARLDLQTVTLETSPLAALWRGYIEAQEYSWSNARRELENGRNVINSLNADWRVRMLNTLARACYELGDWAAAREAINSAWGENPKGQQAAQTRLLEAQILAAQGSPKAPNILATLETNRFEPVAVRATLENVQLGLESGALSPEDAVEALQGLRYRWRGDDFELQVARTLGDLYIKMGDDRHGIEVMRAAWLRQPANPVARRLSDDMMSTFKRLFLDGRADELDPIQALALYYDFKELTPVGAQGDRMIRKLAKRLVDFDLLDQAAELLSHQVEERLDIGPVRARVATDLAGIYLMARQPEKALQAIYGSRYTLLPADLNEERRLLQARSMMDLGRYDHALDIISMDTSEEAKNLRSEISWRMGDWNGAAKYHQELLGPRWQDPDTNLTEREESIVMRMAIAYALAENRQGLDEVRGQYGVLMERAEHAIAFQTITSDASVQGMELREAAKRIADVETFTAFSERLKKRLGEPINMTKANEA